MEVLAEINWGIIAPIIVIQMILMIVAFIDWIKVEKTNGPKLLWLFIILLITTFGPILYFIIGRKER
ncbi:PLDc N-terminal domain-containing protein [Pseudogracilibacillus auburnensis]|uniref:Phospholipase D-like protein n=1 Tax=Pseudogracilibacillus auburnensis TaxID=1494959 RepID=A0A2V3WBQ6_9BACI|nr:PLDc N-terminal domain-containing protein [Pseudogracilibacillus auburnensis]PXW89595.1 phospholipase D-like protein [Pseudogracilibacillus auburnensis]